MASNKNIYIKYSQPDSLTTLAKSYSQFQSRFALIPVGRNLLDVNNHNNIESAHRMVPSSGFTISPYMKVQGLV